LYLGRAYRLALVSDQSCNLQLKEGRFCLNRNLIETGGFDLAKQAFEGYFTEKGLERFAKRAAFFAPKVGVKFSAIKVRDMGFRWASCSAKGVLNFHWKCMMAPPKIIDYIVVHELCHLREANHNDVFWNEVDKILPDYRQRKDWLRMHGASLDI